MTTTRDDTRLQDVYELARLAGGRERAVETAVVVLVETGRVRAERSGTLTALAAAAGAGAARGIEAAVLADLDQGSSRLEQLHELVLDEGRAWQALEADLAGRGLLVRRPRLLALMAPDRGRWSPTREGRAAVAALRATTSGSTGIWLSLPQSQAQAQAQVPGLHGSSRGAVAVALGGPDALPDAALRAALVASGRPSQRRRSDGGEGWSTWWTGAGSGADSSGRHGWGGHGGGHGWGGHGGSGCGGGSSGCGGGSSGCGGGSSGCGGGGGCGGS